MKDPITLLVGYKQGKKVCEVDITSFTDREVEKTILIYEGRGRTYGYEFTSREKMKERREGR